MGGVARGVAIAIGSVGGNAAGGALLASGRLGELPDGRVGDTSGGDWRRIFCADAAGSRRADVVEDPVDEFATADVVVNVVRSDDGDAVAFVVGDA